MSTPLRQLALPVLAGATAYVALYLLLVVLPTAAGLTGADLAQNAVYIHLAPWLPMVQLLVPGMLCGALVARRPLFAGALAGLVGGVAVSVAFETVWETPFHPYSLWLTLQSGLVTAPWLLAGAATGFQLRHMG